MTKKNPKLSYADVMAKLHGAANLNEMKAVVEAANITITDNQLRSMLQARVAEETVRMAMAKPIKIGKPISDRALAKAFPAKETYRIWMDDGDGHYGHHEVPGTSFRDVFRRWEAGEELGGNDPEIFSNRLSATSAEWRGQLYRRIAVPVRLKDDVEGRRFECGDDYTLSFEDGKAVIMLAMNYWAGLSAEDVIDSLPDSEHEVYVYTDSVNIGCQAVDRADVTRMAVEAGFWKAPS